mmetsp:Transcript_20176/g.35885  ORF Transcript_20176/g.35885 Transcript_20176/m.35885 type:complete len:502 (-) Transcript_20176:34-1539(-)
MELDGDGASHAKIDMSLSLSDAIATLRQRVRPASATQPQKHSSTLNDTYQLVPLLRPSSAKVSPVPMLSPDRRNVLKSPEASPKRKVRPQKAWWKPGVPEEELDNMFKNPAIENSRRASQAAASQDRASLIPKLGPRMRKSHSSSNIARSPAAKSTPSSSPSNSRSRTAEGRKAEIEEFLQTFQPSTEAAAAFWGIPMSELYPKKKKRTTVALEDEEPLPAELEQMDADDLDELNQEQLARRKKLEEEQERARKDRERKMKQAQLNSDMSDIRALANEMKLPMNDLKEACQIFREFAEMAGGEDDDDDLFQLVLNMSNFGTMLCRLCDVEDVSALSPEFVKRCSSAADRDGGGSIDVREFAAWYSAYSFSEELTLDSNGKEMRKLSRELGVSVMDIESFKKSFDTFDTDRSGKIDFDEFEQLITQLMKVPGGQQLSKNRVMSLWRTATGGATVLWFSDFCVFYMSVLSPKATEHSDPFTDFYRNVRRVDVAYEVIDQAWES